ncbi:MAG: hypothetical protein HOJ06_06160, partial [Rhodospirillaceae bacterium]|nr:hypothetical protein [Rhodospirillaceae bacterium]
MEYTPYKLKKTIGNSYNMDLDDSLKTKKALAGLGHMKIPDFGLTAYPDQAMIEGVKSFQKEQGLKVDGVMKADGPTIKRLNRTLSGERLKFSNASKDAAPKQSRAGKPVRTTAVKAVEALTNGSRTTGAARSHLKQGIQRAKVQSTPRSITDLLDSDITRRGVLAPYGVKDGKAEIALPQIAVDILRAIQAPADVYYGRKAPAPELAREMALNLNVGSALLGKAGKAAALASRSARLYNAPARPARPFKADYPKGARTDGTGRLTHDIEGRPLQDGSRIVGRRVAGGTDEALPPKEFDAIAKEGTGRPA